MPSRGGRQEDHSPTGGHARVGPAVMAPNTLTLDNWFSAMSTHEPQEGEEFNEVEKAEQKV